MERKIVNMANVESISHDGKETLTVVFKSSGFKYEYTPVAVERYNHLVSHADEETSDLFKNEFNSIKNNPNIQYKKI